MASSSNKGMIGFDTLIKQESGGNQQVPYSRFLLSAYEFVYAIERGTMLFPFYIKNIYPGKCMFYLDWFFYILLIDHLINSYYELIDAY